MSGEGRPGDFEAWYRREHARLLILLAGVTGDRELSCDAVDEALTRALERWDRVGVMASPTAWTYQVALNVARRNARRQALERRLWARRSPEPLPAPAGELWLLVGCLAPRQRTAVLLRHVAQLTEREIAEVMGVARGTVSATLRSAYQQLSDALTDHDRSPAFGELRHD
jgi:RNA polymerase sigma-70 factor (ECF subfamily)